MSNSKNDQLSGPAACSNCSLLNKEVCRSASHVQGGLISCIACKRASTPITGNVWGIRQQPEALRKIVAELISDSKTDNLFALTCVSSGTGTGACLAGHGPDDIGTTIIVVCKDQGVKVELSYTPGEVAYANIGDGGEFDEKLSTMFHRIAAPGAKNVPPAALVAAQKLLGWGFEMTHADLDSAYRCVMFIRGKKVPKTQAVLGIRAQLTWIVD